MCHSSHVGPRLVDFGVDESFGILCAALQVHGIAVEIVLDEVICCDERGRQRTRHEKSIRIPIMPSAHVPVCVHDAFLSKNPIRGHQIFN